MSIPMLKQKRYSWFFNPTLILLLLTIFMWQCEKDDFEGETKGVCPEVISSDPANGATNVVTNKIITATFNEALVPATINNQTFYVELGKVTAVGIVTDANKQLKSLEESNSPTISGVVTYADKVATFTPSKPLEANKTYSGIITKKVKDPAGNYPLKDYIWSFTTGNVPTVISTDPLNAISKVPLNKIITATFTIEMNPSTINGTTFLVHQGTNQIAGTVTYAGKTATFSPTSPLTDNTVYTGTITIAATDLLGNAMASEYKWSFSTA